MKWFVLFLVLFGITAHAQLDLDVGGVYFNAALPGEGVFVQEVSTPDQDVFAVGVFTFRNLSTSEIVPIPLWYTSTFYPVPSQFGEAIDIEIFRSNPVETWPTPDESGNFFISREIVNVTLTFGESSDNYVQPSPEVIATELLVEGVTFSLVLKSRVDANIPDNEMFLTVPGG